MPSSSTIERTPTTEIVVYENGADIRIDVRTDGETVWLTQSQMASLFGCTVRNVRLHLENIYACGELEREATRKDFFLVRTEGAREVHRSVACYNLDAIISVGYRVNSILVQQISAPPPTPPRRKIGFTNASAGGGTNQAPLAAGSSGQKVRKSESPGGPGFVPAADGEAPSQRTKPETRNQEPGTRNQP